MRVDFDVSVVMPAYNAATWIQEAIASVRGQTVMPREIIVADNGSTDDTAALAAAAGARVVHCPGGGPSRARNAGITASSSTFIAFCDADDLWERENLARHGEAYSLCPDVVMTFSDWIRFDDRGALRATSLCNDPEYRRISRTPVRANIVRLNHEELTNRLYRSFFVLTSATVFRKEVLVSAGMFDERLRIAEDYDLFLRVLAVGTAAAIEEPLARYRSHDGSICRDEVVNTESYRLLWERLEGAPERYPPGALEFVRRDRPKRARISGEFAARRGRFAEARAYLAESLQARTTLRAAFWYAASTVFDNPFGRLAYVLARHSWTRRPWRYRNFSTGMRTTAVINAPAESGAVGNVN